MRDNRTEEEIRARLSKGKLPDAERNQVFGLAYSNDDQTPVIPQILQISSKFAQMIRLFSFSSTKKRDYPIGSLKPLPPQYFIGVSH